MLQPFCTNCAFAVHGNGINFEDLSQEKDGLIEVQVGDLDNLGEGYDPSDAVKAATYTWQNGDFVEVPGDNAKRLEEN